MDDLNQDYYIKRRPDVYGERSARDQFEHAYR